MGSACEVATRPTSIWRNAVKGKHEFLTQRRKARQAECRIVLARSAPLREEVPAYRFFEPLASRNAAISRSKSSIV